MKPDEKPETTDAIYGQCVEIGNDNDGQPMLIIHTTKEAIKAFSGSMLYRPVAVMPVERAETPVEQRQNVSEGDQCAPAVKAVRSENQTLFARILFVYAKAGKIECFSADEIRGLEHVLQKEGWVHTATIDPARWIEAMANGYRDPSDMLDELQFGIKP